MMSGCGSAPTANNSNAGSGNPVVEDTSKPDKPTKNNQNELQAACIADIQAGLQARWEITSNEVNNVSEFQQRTKQSIEQELTYIDKYTAETFDSDSSFKDEEFKNAILMYVDAVKSQLEGVDYWQTDAAQYNSLFIDNGFKVRSESINTLVNNYELKVDNEYQSELDKVLSGDCMRMISPGEPVTVSCDFGDVKVTIDGIEATDWGDYNIWGEYITDEDKMTIAVLKCGIENKSYYDQYNVDIVRSELFLTVCDMEYYIQSTSDSGSTYKEYGSAPGGTFKLKQGQRQKEAIPYCLASNVDRVYIVIGNKYEMFLDVENK